MKAEAKKRTAVLYTQMVKESSKKVSNQDSDSGDDMLSISSKAQANQFQVRIQQLDSLKEKLEKVRERLRTKLEQLEGEEARFGRLKNKLLLDMNLTDLKEKREKGLKLNLLTENFKVSK